MKRYLAPVVAGLVGVLVAAPLSPLLPAVVTVAFGGTVVVVAAWVLGERSRFALAGTGYLLGFGAVIATTGLGGEAYQRTVLVALLGFGALSAGLLVVRAVISWLLTAIGRRLIDPDSAGALAEFLSTLGSLLALVWTVLTAQEKAIRMGGIPLVGLATFVLNLLGVEIPVPVWFLSEGVDATVVLYVGSVIAGFWTLDTLRTAATAAKETASSGADAGRSATDSARDRL